MNLTVLCSLFLWFGITFTLCSNIDFKSETSIDCYYQNVTHSNTSRINTNLNVNICKTDYFRLPDIFEDDVDENLNESFTTGIICCPADQGIANRSPGKIMLWPNEIRGTLTRAFLACHPTDIPGLDSIRFLLYTKKTLGLFDYKEIYINDLNTLSNSGFMKESPVKIIIHGFMSSAFVGPAPALRSAYASIPDKINIIAVHWEALANLVTLSDGICYDIASQSTKFVGRKTANMIEFLVKSNYTKLDKIHVMGHSLGSHCAGFTGKFLKIGRLPRITAFDPARPGFDEQPPTERLDYTDAEFVDVIHTATKQWKILGTLSQGFLPFPVGIKKPMGHLDFYPNKGTHQPGCILQLQKLPVLCSHSRSYAYYADSVRFRNERIFLAEECKQLEQVEKGDCLREEGENENNKVIMGEYTTISNYSRKIFVVKTNSRSPFPQTLVKGKSLII